MQNRKLYKTKQPNQLIGLFSCQIQDSRFIVVYNLDKMMTAHNVYFLKATTLTAIDYSAAGVSAAGASSAATGTASTPRAAALP